MPVTGRPRSWLALSVASVLAGGCEVGDPADVELEDGELDIVSALGGDGSLRIQAEDYDDGGEGVAYHDTTPGNTGGAYRQDDVDIQSGGDTPDGHNVGWIRDGETLAYTFDAPVPGSYDIVARVSSGTAGTKRVRAAIDGGAAAAVTYDGEPGWQVYDSLLLGSFDLTAGEHRLELAAVLGGFNVDYVDLVWTASCTPSRHYGTAGEDWSPAGRLIDHAYAGYHGGESSIPTPTSSTQSVSDFGARPNDGIDDTQAFLDAIASTSARVLTIPEGRFIITRKIIIRRSNLVLRGAGRGKTVLYFPRSLGDVYGISFNGSGQSSWSFGGAFLTIDGSDSGKTLASITADASRGSRKLLVSTTAGITVGQLVRVVQRDSNGTLLRAYHAGEYAGNTTEDKGKELFHFYSRVEAIGSGTITLERTLPIEVVTAWSPQVRAVAPTVKEAGIERLTVEFLGTTYPGHFKERGYNAIQLDGAFDSWVRDVEVLNADFGINLAGSYFCTVADVVLDTTVNRGTRVGHHGLNASMGNDNLFVRFDIRKTFVHDLTVDAYAFATVFADGRGVDLNLDHHGRAPYGSLFTRLDLGAGTRPWVSGGKEPSRMPHSGARSVFWNLVADRDIPLPPSDFGPQLTFVGMQGSSGIVPSGWSVERVAPADLCQQDLHRAMRRQRDLAFDL